MADDLLTLYHLKHLDHLRGVDKSIPNFLGSLLPSGDCYISTTIKSLSKDFYYSQSHYDTSIGQFHRKVYSLEHASTFPFISQCG
jgi:hypothetical protein